MSTYTELRDRALGQVGCTGQTEAQTVAQVALEEAMKFVTFFVRIPSLIASATATAPATPEDEANAITLGASGFNITSTYSRPDRLYIKKNAAADGKGRPYQYLEYHHFLDLKEIPAGERIGVYETSTLDERPDRCYTITPSGKLWASPIVELNFLTLFFRKTPAAYSGAASPEILPAFDYILVNAAVLALKEWLREPAELTTLWKLFEQGLMDDVRLYDRELNGQYRRTHLKIHRSYRPT